MMLQKTLLVTAKALVSADEILPGSSFKLQLLVINLTLPAGRPIHLRAGSWSMPQLHKASTISRNVLKALNHLILIT
jgi:hypothetical protein